ncbi:MAG: hypothetical protein OXT67_09750, partial [Zetaproteobacteria bacterium]|nr:hypothetical protein [Zetaproteobacteria bacterium]
MPKTKRQRAKAREAERRRQAQAERVTKPGMQVEMHVGSEDAPQHEQDVERQCPPLELPKYAERYLGKEIFESFHLMADELADYEQLVLDGELDIQELAEYLGVIDFFEEYPDFIKNLAVVLQLQTEKMQVELEKQYSPDKAFQKVLTGIQNCFAAARKDRPVLKMVLAELGAEHETLVNSQIFDQEKATLKKAGRDFESDPDPTALEKEFLARRIRASMDAGVTDPQDVIDFNGYPFALLFAKRTSIESPTTESVGDEEAQKNKPADRELLKLYTVESDYYPLPITKEWPWVSSVDLVIPETGNPYIWGKILVTWKEDAPGSGAFDSHTSFNISHFTDELCNWSSGMLPAARIFERYGGADEFRNVENQLLQSILDNIDSGAIPIVEQQQEETQRIEDALLDVEMPEILEESDEEEAVEEVVDVAETKTILDQKIAAAQQGTVKQEQKRRKIRYRNLRYSKVLATFQRLGVEVSHGGRHPKLIMTRDGKQR